MEGATRALPARNERSRTDTLTGSLAAPGGDPPDASDFDDDGVPHFADDCFLPNAGQSDANANGVGDLCEAMVNRAVEDTLQSVLELENETDSNGMGSVAYEFDIADTEVTDVQYVEFLDAVAAGADPYGFFNGRMAAPGRGRAGRLAPGSAAAAHTGSIGASRPPLDTRQARGRPGAAPPVPRYGSRVPLPPPKSDARLAGARPSALRAAGPVALALLLALAALLPETSRAHGRSISYSSWQLDEEGAEVRVRVSRLDLSRLPAVASEAALPAAPGPASNTARYVAERLRLYADGEPCSPSSAPAPESAAEGWVALRWRVDCRASGARVIESRLLLDVAPSHLHFTRIASSAGAERSALERVLTEAAPAWSLGDWQGESGAGQAGAPAPLGSSFLQYLYLGIEHILTGYDHLAFVLALLLLAGSLGQVAGLVTGFTVAHSITLALAVLGLLHPEAAAVEAVIGFSVALIAAENAWVLSGRDPHIVAACVVGLLLLCALALAGFGVLSVVTLLGLSLFSLCHFELLARTPRPNRVRTFLAFAFGLVHGFGFAGVLAEMSLPTARLAPALFGFNLGVEVGQLAVVALAWPLLRLLARASQGRWYAPSSQLLSAGICGLGLYWFIARAFSEG